MGGSQHAVHLPWQTDDSLPVSESGKSVNCWQRLVLIFAILLGGWSGGSCAFAQDSDEKGAENQAPEKETTEAEAENKATTTKSKAGVPLPEGDGLDVYVLRNKAGELVKMPGWKLEDFRKAWERERLAAPAAPPSHSIDSLTVTGIADDSGANFEAKFTIRLREGGWVKVPLHLQGAALVEEPIYEGTGDHVVLPGSDEEGLVCWLQGKDNKPHVVRCKLRSAITSIGDERQLAVTFARGTESSLTLTVPQAPVECSLGETPQSIVATKVLGENKSEIRVLGLGGPLRLQWHRTSTKEEQGVQLEASGEVTVRVEGQNRISSDLRLKLRRFNGPLDTFRVRLPAGMRLQGGATTGYSVRAITGTAAETGNTARQLVEVKLERPTTGIAEIQLVAVLTPELQTADLALEPASFEVVEAVRHRGSVEFTVEGNWLLDWQEDAATRRVAIAGEAAVGRGARFEYFRQPCGLQLRVSPEPTRISVEPLYLANVDAAQVRLEATYKFRLRGARVGQLNFDLRGWRFDRISPETAVDSSLVTVTETDQLVVPLRLAASTGDIEIKLEAHRDIVPGSPTIEFSVPRPKADMVTPGALIIVPADNIDLTPDLAASRGFTADSLPVGIKLPQRQQSPLVYRDSSTKEPPRIVSGFQIRSRRTTVAAAAKVQFERQLIRVQQRLNYRISHEPQRVFSLITPVGFDIEVNELRVMQGNEVLQVLNSEVEPGEAVKFRGRIRFSAPSEQLGPCEFVLQYTLPLSQLKENLSQPVPIPLLCPPAEEVQATLGQTIQVSWPSGLLVNPVPENTQDKVPWNLETISRQELRATSSRLVGQSYWSINQDPNQRSGLTQIDRAWIQSWLMDDGVMQRTCWKVKSSSKEILVVLPKGTDPRRTEVVLEGQAVLDAMREGNQLRIALPSSLDSRNFHLEIWHFTPQDTRLQWLSPAGLQAPSIADSLGAYPSIWQVTTGTRDPIIDWPSNFELRCSPMLLGLIPAREGEFSQPRVRKWIGNTTPLESWPAGQAYTFLSFGPTESLQITRMDYRVLLWGGSMLIVGLTILISKVSVLRHPNSLLIYAIALGTGTAAAPQFSSLLLQGGSIGLLVACAVAAWHWRFGTKPLVPTAPPTVSTSKVSEPRSSPLILATSTPEPNSQDKPKPSSTATAALLPATEQHP